MANKKTTHGESKTQAKNNVQNPKKNEREHQRGEIISRDELEKRAGSPEMQPLFSRYTCRSLKKGKLISTTPGSSRIWRSISMRKKFYTYPNTVGINLWKSAV